RTRRSSRSTSDPLPCHSSFPSVARIHTDDLSISLYTSSLLIVPATAGGTGGSSGAGFFFPFLSFEGGSATGGATATAVGAGLPETRYDTSRITPAISRPLAPPAASRMGPVTNLDRERSPWA